MWNCWMFVAVVNLSLTFYYGEKVVWCDYKLSLLQVPEKDRIGLGGGG